MSAPTPPTTPLHESRLARFGITLIVFGVLVFAIGLFPQAINLDITEGIGLMQIYVFLGGVGIMTLGGYVYAYATRHRSQARRLREDIGLRLGATGYVICVVSGLSDVLGIGTHNSPDVRPYLGPWQAVGILVGLGVIVFGVGLYAGRYNPPDEGEGGDEVVGDGGVE